MLISRALLLALLAAACTHPLRASHQQSTPFTLTNPAQVSTDTVTLAVGTNHWSGQSTSLIEDAFLPLAVTVRNTSTKTLCGGVATAVLSDSAGTSSSAIFPEGVVAKLIGPLAGLDPRFLPTSNDTTIAHEEVFLLRIDSHGGHTSSTGHSSGGFHSGSGFQGGFGGTPHLGGTYRGFTPLPFGQPYHSPLSPLGGTHRSFVPAPFSGPYYSPFSPFSPSPFSPFSSPFYPPSYSPFYSPWPSPSPYGDMPYRYAPLPSPDLHPPREEPQETNTPALKEILTAAFASRSLAPQEERSGFLFFQLPIPQSGSTVLTWDWYDCSTHELIAHLSIPLNAERRL